MNNINKLISHQQIFLESFLRKFSESCSLQSRHTRNFPHSELPGRKNNRWVVVKPIWDRPEYTTEPIFYPRTGGRGPNGRIWNHRRAGGLRRYYHMIDWVRSSVRVRKLAPDSITPGPPGTDGVTLVERVMNIMPDRQNRSGLLALVASGDSKRYILAGENMKVGDLIRSTTILSKTPVRPKEGDSYPLGSLSIGTIVSCVEQFPGKGGYYAKAAGTSALLVRKQLDPDDNRLMCVVRLPSKREAIVSAECAATVGRISNIFHNKQKFKKFGEKAWLGIRPRSGLWKRKTGRFGRKNRAIPPPIILKDKLKDKPIVKRYTMPNPPGVYETWRF